MSQSGPPLNKVFYKGRWAGGGEETTCGGGSTMEATAAIRANLPGFLKRNRVGTFLDAPCGDFYWMKTVDLGDIHYTGMDIVHDYIVENQREYASPKRTFLLGDITKDPLPKVDMMMVRDCLIHLPFAYIHAFFDNFLRSGIPNLLLTQQKAKVNVDLERPGLYRGVNFLLEPLSFPEPVEWVPDFLPGQRERNLCHWTREQIAKAVQSRTA